ncbi:MAG: RagB/SusD family nutrient uptake outer membrane protein [Fermentimonas sp.]
MKNITCQITLLSLIILGFGCNKLDLSPLAEGSSESWYSSDNEVRMSIDYLYNINFWNSNPDLSYFNNGGWLDAWSDDWTNRDLLNDITNGTINSQTSFVVNFWTRYYKCIAQANYIIEKITERKDQFSEAKFNQYLAEAKFVRARMYSWLIFLYGDVPYYDSSITVEEAFSMGRIDKAEILKKIYEDFDFASSILPISWSGTKYPTKGAALALKARIALWMQDYQTARDAAKSCIDLNAYQLYPDFFELGLTKNKNSAEIIWSIPRSVELNSTFRAENARQRSPRTTGGNAFIWPSWDLFCSFLCSDGLPIDESPLYNPRKPFENRDPRLSATIVEHGTSFGGVIWQPHPDSLKCTKVPSGERVNNRESSGVDQWAPWNGIMWRKFYDEDWFDDFLVAPEQVEIRFADVLLIYAEAKIELGETDQTVLDAMNRVRARAYKVDYTSTSLYPVINTKDVNELRKILRIERRMEFAFEGLRYPDLLRWRLAEKALTKPTYGLLLKDELREKIVRPGLWFFPEVTPIDEDGLPDFTPMFEKGLIRRLAIRNFDKSRNYLWPIPNVEIQINENIKQNPGY